MEFIIYEFKNGKHMELLKTNLEKPKIEKVIESIKHKGYMRNTFRYKYKRDFIDTILDENGKDKERRCLIIAPVNEPI